MNRLQPEKQKQILAALVEGNSIRATCRMTGAAKGTVLKLLCDIGQACDDYQNKVLRNLNCSRLQVDEIWAFCHSKEKNVPEENKGILGFGDVWTFIAICAETKIVPCWLIGHRDFETAHEFIKDLASRLRHRVQLTTDGHKMYLNAVEFTFGDDIDYAQLIKIYGSSPESEVRYSPAQCVETKKVKITGRPDTKHISTSYVERQNLTMRMQMRRFTRLTNAFSKKVENLGYAIALHFMYYNFCRIHQTLRVTPAMEADVTDRVWNLDDILALLEK